MQVAFLSSVRAEGHFAWVVRDTTMDAFEAWLVGLDASIEYAARKEIAPPEVGGPMVDAIATLMNTEVLNPERFRRAAGEK